MWAADNLPCRSTTIKIKSGKMASIAQLRRLVLVEGLSNAGGDLVNIIVSVDVGNLLTVVLQHGGGLGVELVEAGAELVLGIVAAVHQGLAGHVVLALHLGRAEVGVVGAATGRVDPATSHALHEKLVVDVQVDDLVDADVLLLEQTVQDLGLVDSSGETVQDKALVALRALDSVGNNTSNNLITHELASIHKRLSLEADLGAVLDGISEHVTSGQVAQAVLLLNSGSLGSLASTRRAEKDSSPEKKKDIWKILEHLVQVSTDTTALTSQFQP